MSGTHSYVCPCIFVELSLDHDHIWACICLQNIWAIFRFGGCGYSNFHEGTKVFSWRFVTLTKIRYFMTVWPYFRDSFGLSRKWYISWRFIHFHDGFVLPRNDISWRLYTLMKINIPGCFRPPWINFVSCFPDLLNLTTPHFHGGPPRKWYMTVHPQKNSIFVD